MDDDPLIHSLIKSLFQGRDVEIVSSLRSMGVLNLINMHRPALVIIDVRMPGLEGPSLVKLVRQDPMIADIPVLLCSAQSEEVMAAKAKECGADGYILKMRGPEHLEETILSWLSTSRRPAGTR